MRSSVETRVFGVLLVCLGANFTNADDLANSGDDVQPLDLVLIRYDLKYGDQAIVRYDHNEDGKVDSEELKRVPWRDEISGCDINSDGKLTQIEFCVRSALVRQKDSILQVDFDFAAKDLSRHDRNRNGQLDASEIAEGWPLDPESYDVNHDGVITLFETAKHYAIERGFREAMGIEGVDQGGALKLVNRHDRDQDRKLDSGELANAQIEQEAGDFDHDDDGKMSVLELATMLAKRRMDLGLSLADQRLVRKLLQRIDRNKDGVIPWDEYGENGPMGQLLVEFNDFDLNKDRAVTEREIEQRFAAKRKEKAFDDASAARTNRIMARCDTNHDKSLSKSELAKTLGDSSEFVTSFSTIDVSKDAKISWHELAQSIYGKQK